MPEWIRRCKYVPVFLTDTLGVLMHLDKSLLISRWVTYHVFYTHSMMGVSHGWLPFHVSNVCIELCPRDRTPYLHSFFNCFNDDSFLRCHPVLCKRLSTITARWWFPQTQSQNFDHHSTRKIAKAYRMGLHCFGLSSRLAFTSCHHPWGPRQIQLHLQASRKGFCISKDDNQTYQQYLRYFVSGFY